MQVDDTEYKLTPGLLVLMTQKHPRTGQWNSKYHFLIGQALLDHTLRGNGSI